MAEQKEEPGKINLTTQDFSDWEVGDNYQILKQIGSGSYGYVVEAKQKSTGQKVAIKRINNLFDDLIDCKRILREITLLRLLKHPNLISILEIIPPKDWEDFDNLYVVFEECQSDLQKLFQSPVHLQALHIQTLTYNILCGLKYLHSAEVLHRDLKPANVLINEDCTVKICDFGLARSVEGIEGASVTEEAEEPLILPKEEKKEVVAPKGNPKLVKQSGLSQVQNMKRELTGHVVTRWYRAPELILLEQDYTSAIDMWSVGCIFAELLNMIQENAPTFLDRAPLFPGNSCFPLSPDHNNSVKKGGFPHSHSDQLNVIFTVLGTPLEQDMSFVTDSKAIDYLKSFNPKQRVNFKEIYPAATPEAIDFLEKTLQLNPKQRISVDDALNHPLFSKCRDKEKEFKAESPASLPFEQEGDMDGPKLRKYFVEEIRKYHPQKK